MGSEDGDGPSRILNSAQSNGGRPDPAPQYSYVKSRLQRSRAEAAHDIKSWATDGMKGHVLLVRNSRMLVANIIAERSLETQLWDLARERNECLRARDRDRQLFLKHLGLKGDRFRDIVVRIESRKKVRPSTVHLPVFERRGLLSHVHEYPLVRSVSRRTTSGDEATKPETLMVHPLPFMSATKGEGSKDDEILPGTDLEPSFHKEESQLVQRTHLRCSTSAIPATRGRYESCIPVRVPVRDNVTADFLRSSDLLQYTPASPEDENGLDLCPEPEPEIRPKSCCVFSTSPRRPLTAPESILVSQLIDDIDSLHLPSRNQKKTKARTDLLLREIFRS